MATYYTNLENSDMRVMWEQDNLPYREQLGKGGEVRLLKLFDHCITNTDQVAKFVFIFCHPRVISSNTVVVFFFIFLSQSRLFFFVLLVYFFLIFRPRLLYFSFFFFYNFPIILSSLLFSFPLPSYMYFLTFLFPCI